MRRLPIAFRTVTSRFTMQWFEIDLNPPPVMILVNVSLVFTLTKPKIRVLIWSESSSFEHAYFEQPLIGVLCIILVMLYTFVHDAIWIDTDVYSAGFLKFSNFSETLCILLSQYKHINILLLLITLLTISINQQMLELFFVPKCSFVDISFRISALVAYGVITISFYFTINLECVISMA